MSHSPKVETIEDAVIRQLVRLMGLCEEHDLDLDLMINAAQLIHSGEPEIGT
jgi:hypothetical protein